MPDQDRSVGAQARKAADRLALALEDVGFDVGHDFPALHGDIGQRGTGVVRIGEVQAGTADRLADVLWRAANAGISTANATGGA